ncbi:unnamed protein product [Adineta ricciae]|uniref:TGF-beta family profile domain-containing protein n=1 Tax=Adineta ricciae TaxID=249248 RepID=A0A815YXK5_ADIRI|nr:unnamed protein product [Adineta ricciae]
MEHTEPTTVSSSKSSLFVIITLFTAICIIIIITIVLFTANQHRPSSTPIANPQSLKTILKHSTPATTTTTLSPEEHHRMSAYKEFLDLPSNHPNPNPSRSTKAMHTFMRSIYRQIYDEQGSYRRKRHDEDEHSNFYLLDTSDSIISLPNQHHSSSSNITYHFQYNASLEHLSYAELIVPIQEFSTLDIVSSSFHISLKASFRTNSNWLKINLTQYITSFPLTFYLRVNHTKQTFALLSSGFLTLHFRQSSSSMSRRQLSSFYDNQLVTYPDEPSYCQVRPLRASFSDLRWSSWILEPSSYEMNVCSGTCQTQSNMDTYFLIQNLLHQKYPRTIPAPCCKPKRFSPTILLYYDGPNLVLKKHENMRVVECGCS